jgi:hypothetical protein
MGLDISRDVIDVKKTIPLVKTLVIPPPTGFGSEEDSIARFDGIYEYSKG